MSPLMLELHSEHKARMQRFAEAAMRPQILPAPPPPEPGPVAAPIEREIVKHESWFWMIKELPSKYPKIELIQRAVAYHYQVRREDILSARRTANVMRPRQIAMYLAKRLTPKSLPEIGRRFGGRDHTTILHGVRKIEALASSDMKLSADLELLEAALKPMEAA